MRRLRRAVRRAWTGVALGTVATKHELDDCSVAIKNDLSICMQVKDEYVGVI